MQTNPQCIFLRALLGQRQNFTTRAEIKSALDRMTRVVKQCVADHPTEDGAHQNVKELLRAILRRHFDGDIPLSSKLVEGDEIVKSGTIGLTEYRLA